MSSIDAILERLALNEGQALDRLFDILRIPSISTMPEHARSCEKAAAWFFNAFSEMGFSAQIVATPGHPAVVAQYRNPDPDRPHIVYYGHYDVQPTDPIAAWTTDPFEPAIADSEHGPQIVARGAADDKGQVVAWMEAFRAHLAVDGCLPVHVTAIVEGEEETGSPHFEHVLYALGGDFHGDAAIISDGTMWDRSTASITTQLRGLVYLEVTVATASMDLHSGLFGGAVPNAAHCLCMLLANLIGTDGRIAVPGFYDDVKLPPAHILSAWKDLEFDEVRFLEAVGLTQVTGEHGYSLLERLWSRPTAEVNGIWGGFTGLGTKTVVPKNATAKVSFRLVPGQDPQKVVAGFRQFADEYLGPDCRAEIDVIEAAPAVELPSNNRWSCDAIAALGDEFGKPPLQIGCGGSLEAVNAIQHVLGIPTVLFSFGLDDDRVHGPNEKFDLACFRLAARSHARLLSRWTYREK